jgi:hypothetical protein
MPAIRSGHVSVFYLFDVAEAITLPAVPPLLGAPTVAARLSPKPVTPSYVQYQQPPLMIDGEAVQHGAIEGFKTRIKMFDYGVVSIGLSRPFAGSWTELIALGQHVIENPRLEQAAEECCRALLERVRPALTRLHDRFLAEDYVVFSLTGLDEPLTSEVLIERHADEIALLLRGERHALSRQEREEVLRHRISYLADDLVVPTWNAALVYDTEPGAQAALEILEFANSQLLEFRYHDDLLDSELTRIYADLQRPRVGLLRARRYTRAAHAVHALLIDLHELTDHAENALKFVGDPYAARLFTLAAARLGLDRWKASVQEKLKTLDDIYRFAVEQTSISRGEFLELTVVILILLEVILFLLSIMK